jgi:hypothetical protein
MKSDGVLKSFVLVGLVVIALYFVFFYAIESCRRVQGPWQVTFATNSGGPAIEIAQPRLQIGRAIIFHGEPVTASNPLPQKVSFDRPLKPVPFGKVIYEDLTQLPGVVTFDLFGHEIELLPRVLIVNKRQIKWNAQTTIELWPTNKLPQPPKPRPGWNQ